MNPKLIKCILSIIVVIALYRHYYEDQVDHFTTEEAKCPVDGVKDEGDIPEGVMDDSVYSWDDSVSDCDGPFHCYH